MYLVSISALICAMNPKGSYHLDLRYQKTIFDVTIPFVAAFNFSNYIGNLSINKLLKMNAGTDMQEREACRQITLFATFTIKDPPAMTLT